jgi:hypothetical protein
MLSLLCLVTAKAHPVPPVSKPVGTAGPVRLQLVRRVEPAPPPA